MNVDYRVRGGSSVLRRVTRYDPDADSAHGNLSRPAMSCNLAYVPGGCVSAGGFVKLGGIPGTSGKAAYFRRYDFETDKRSDMLVAASDEGIFVSQADGGEFTEVDLPRGVSLPEFINYRLDGKDVLIISAPDRPLTVWDGGVNCEIAADAPRIKSACLHSERLFACGDGDGSRLWFSDDLDPRNWSVSLDEGGYVELTGMKGNLIKVTAFLDYVYVFRSYGISRLTAYGDQTQFAVTELFTSTGRIYPDSVTVCGDSVIFLAEDGLYRFDGLNAVKMNLGLDDFLLRADKSALAGGFYSGSYFLALRADFGGEAVGCEKGGYVNNTVIKLDISESKATVIRGFDIVSLAAVLTDGDGYLAGIMREDGKLFAVRFSEQAEGYPASLTFAETDLGYPDRVKLIKKIHFRSNADVEIKCSFDGAEKLFVSRGGSVGVYTAAKRFGMKLTVEGRVKLSELAVEAETV